MKYISASKRLVFVRRQERLEQLAADQNARRAERRATIERRSAATRTSVGNKVKADRSKPSTIGRKTGDKRVTYFPAPEEFNLSASYETTVKFLMQFRRWGSSSRNARSFYVDLRPVRKISPAGALLLAAEFHRWKLVYNRKLRARDAPEWNEEVLSLLGTMGFFDLLSVDQNTLPAVSNSNDGMFFLPFGCGRNTDGRPFLKLRDMIEASVGRLRQRLMLYQGVTEAITNVLHHAYTHSNNLSRWWMSASIDRRQSKLTVMVLDHGEGIPRTLPRKGVVEKIQEFLNVASLAAYSNDGRMIEAAVTLGRSAVQQRNRGHGLQRDIQAAIRSFDGTARLRIHSNRGKYTFERDYNGNVSTSTSTAVQSLYGTFIEWTFELPQLGLILQ